MSDVNAPSRGFTRIPRDVEAMRGANHIGVDDFCAVLGIETERHMDWVEGRIPLSPYHLHRLLQAYGIEMNSILSPFEGIRTLGRAKPWVRLAADDDGSLRKVIDRWTLYKGLLSLSPSPRLAPPADHSVMAAGMSPRDAGEAAAASERKRLGLDDGPVPDICDRLRQTGIVVATTALPANKSGLFMFAVPDAIAIFATRRDSVARQRFTLAHEYAHALFDRGVGVILDGDVSAGPTPGRTTDVEARADAFAAAFLVPVDHLVSEHGARSGDAVTDADVTRLAGKYEVSRGVMIRRLHEAGIIGPVDDARLSGAKVDAPAVMQMQGSDLVDSIASLAEGLHATNLISSGRLREVLAFLGDGMKVGR